jgi:predicted ATPase
MSERAPAGAPIHQLHGPLIGRDREVAAIARLLRRESVRTVALIGPAGVGKTALALAVVEQIELAFGDGAVTVSLESLVRPDLLLPALAQALGVSDHGDEPLFDAVRHHLEPLHLLLVLDHVDRTLPELPFMMRLLDAAPGLNVLLTSRSPTRLEAEESVAILPLGVPGPRGGLTMTQLARMDAPRLLLDRLQAARPGLALDEEHADIVAEVCRMTGGLPLALELVAARARDRSLLDLLAGLQTQASRPLDAASAIRWSVGLLSDAQRVVLHHLGLFADGFTVPSAQDVVGPAHAQPDQQLRETLQSLVDLGLLRRDTRFDDVPGGGPRFNMPPAAREVALEQFADRSEVERARERFAIYYLTLAASAEIELIGRAQMLWYDRLIAENDNVRAALAFAIERGEADLGQLAMGSLWRFWDLYGFVHEGRRWLEEALALGTSAERASALFGAGRLAYLTNDVEAARRHLSECLELSRQQGNERLIAGSLTQLGHIALRLGQISEARVLYERGLTIRNASGDRWGMAISLQSLGTLAAGAGDLATAERLYRESLDHYLTAGDLLAAARVQHLHGALLLAHGHLEPARERLETSLALRRELGDPRGIPESLTSLGELERERRDLERAKALLLEALRLRRESGDREGLVETLYQFGRTIIASGDPAHARKPLAEGLALARERDAPAAIANGLDAFARLRSSTGDALGAARLWGAADAVRAARRGPPEIVAPARREREQERARARVDAATWHAELAAGATLSLDQAVELALTTDPAAASDRYPVDR